MERAVQTYTTLFQVFYTTRVDGVLEIWDFMFDQSVPIFPLKD